jgi:hypothetical protein
MPVAKAVSVYVFVDFDIEFRTGWRSLYNKNTTTFH